MLVRTLSLALAGLLIGGGHGPAGQDPVAQLNAVADGYQRDRLAAFPELGTQFGIPGARHDRLRDASAAG